VEDLLSGFLVGTQGLEGDVTTVVRPPWMRSVDTTAAGDVFNAALAVACSEGATLIEACRFAVNAAALSVTCFGAQRGVPSRADLNSFIGRASRSQMFELSPSLTTPVSPAHG
jgi:sugar/nucleoside kinase (ribokinase family)